MPRMSFRPPSFVSPTSAFTDFTRSLPGIAACSDDGLHRRADAQGVGEDDRRFDVPSSSTCVDPASFPNALPTNTAPGTLSWNRFPAAGHDRRDARADVSPWISVVCPTRTPATSVMALRGPGGKTPGASPSRGPAAVRSGR